MKRTNYHKFIYQYNKFHSSYINKFNDCQFKTDKIKYKKHILTTINEIYR